MYGPIEMLTRSARPLALAAGILATTLLAGPASARGPENIADVAEKVIDAVVNISTSQTVTSLGEGGAMRQPRHRAFAPQAIVLPPLHRLADIVGQAIGALAEDDPAPESAEPRIGKPLDNVETLFPCRLVECRAQMFVGA